MVRWLDTISATRRVVAGGQFGGDRPKLSGSFDEAERSRPSLL
ncbi:MAG: hypothetical protein AAFY26_09680 [Cyanobacteria bacterium J06638_22]